MKEMMRSGTFQAEAYMAGLYRAMMQSESALAAYRDFFDLLLAGPQTLLWHCSAGKDRAGIAAALVLCALGVSRQEIMEDYLLTNRCTALQAGKSRPGAFSRRCGDAGDLLHHYAGFSRLSGSGIC